MDLTDAYENGAYIPNAADYPVRWAAEAATFRARLGDMATLDVAYGTGARQVYDLFRPVGEARGLLVFIHGGYWRRFDKSMWSHLAAGPIARGWVVAMPSYTLAPEARISEITQEVTRAVVAAAKDVHGPIVLTGHSAGGHLSARMRCKDIALPTAVSERIKRIVPISPLSDLRPLMQTDMNVDLRLDAAEAAAESPILHDDLLDVDTHVWVGGIERPAFLDQARWLSDAWGAGLTIAKDRHHFDVIEPLTAADSELTETLLA